MTDKTMLKIAAELLDLANDEFCNHTCTDFEIDNTPENVVFVKKMYNDAVCGVGDENDLDIVDGGKKILIENFVGMYYCAKMLRKMAEE